jgi:mRNA interferase MazF
VKPGDIVLVPVPQAAGMQPKLRPALVLAMLPGPYQRFLLCGISTRLQNLVGAWDEAIQRGDADYRSSGLHQHSIIRLSFLYAAMPAELTNPIGSIDQVRLMRLRQRLSDHLRL